MNKYTLKFNDEILEKLYRRQQLDKIRKPVYLGLCVGSIILNSIKIIIDFVNDTIEQSYINMAFLIFTIVQFIYVRTNPIRREYVIHIASYLSVLFQLNLNPNAENQYAYLFGSNMMMIHTTFLIIQEFRHAFLQVLIQLIVRVVITIQLTTYLDFQTYILGLLGSIFLLIGLYYCDHNSRQCFLASVREDNRNQLLSFVLKEPYMHFKYDEDKMQFQMIQHSQITKFHGYEQTYCDGCNLRNILRINYYEGETLENGLFKNSMPVKLELQVTSKGMKSQMKFGNYGVLEQKYILILDNQIKQIYNHKTIKNGLLQCRLILKKSRSIYFSKVLYWNIMCSLTINEKTISTMSVNKILEKCIRTYRKISSIQFIIVKHKDILVNTYVYQFNILFIQIFNILINNKQDRLVIFKINNTLTIKTNNIKVFEQNYRNNYLIQQLESQILCQPMSNRLELSFIPKVYMSFK